MSSGRGPRVGPWDHLLGFLICATYIAVLLAGSPDLGMSRDESFYVAAGQDYAGWFQLLADDSSAAMEQEAIDSAWDYNHEHPGLIKVTVHGVEKLDHLGDLADGDRQTILDVIISDGGRGGRNC